MGYQAGDAPVAIQEGMYPEHSVVRRRSRKYFFRLSQTPVGALKMGEESRHCAGTDWDVLTDAHITVP